MDMDIFCGYHYLGFGSLTLGYHVLHIQPCCGTTVLDRSVCVISIILKYNLQFPESRCFLSTYCRPTCFVGVKI